MKRPRPKSMNKKILIPIVIVAVAITSFGAYAIFAPPSNGGGGGVCDETVNCMDDKLCDACYCPEFYDKIAISKSFGGGWYCEQSELFLDPDNAYFHQEVMNWVRGKLTQDCGDTCTDLTCGDNELCYDYDTGESAENRGACIDVAVGQGNTGERLINAECVVTEEWEDSGDSCNSHDDCESTYWFNACIDGTCQRQKSGYIYWRMNFFIESDESNPETYPFLDNYCTDPEATKRCTTQEFCSDWEEYKLGEDSSWCIPDLEMDIRDYTPPLSVFPTCATCLPRDSIFEDDCIC